MRRMRLDKADDYEVAVEDNYTVLTLTKLQVSIRMPIHVSASVSDALAKASTQWMMRTGNQDVAVDFDLLERTLD